MKLIISGNQTCQVSRISQETPAFERFLSLTRRIAKISRITRKAVSGSG
jgi:hypothetical protein